MNTLSTLQEILTKDYKVPRDRLRPEALLTDLGVDSLGMLELMFKIEDEFHLKIPGDPPTDLSTVADVVAYVDGLRTGKNPP
jgi:acyl carrier protein